MLVQKVIEGNTTIDYWYADSFSCNLGENVPDILYGLAIRQFQIEESFRKKAIREINRNILQVPEKLLWFSVDKKLEYPVLAKVDMDGAINYVCSPVYPIELPS